MRANMVGKGGEARRSASAKMLGGVCGFAALVGDREKKVDVDGQAVYERKRSLGMSRLPTIPTLSRRYPDAILAAGTRPAQSRLTGGLVIAIRVPVMEQGSQ